MLDGERLEVDAGAFDAVISRVGFIYFPDQQGALRGMRRALKPGGRLAASSTRRPSATSSSRSRSAIIRRRAQLPAPLPGQPGPFSLGAAGRDRGRVRGGGLRRRRDAAHRRAPLRLASAAECVRFERESFGALHQMLASLDEQGRDEAWQEIEQELRRFETADGFAGPCELIVAAGTKR